MKVHDVLGCDTNLPNKDFLYLKLTSNPVIPVLIVD